MTARMFALKPNYNRKTKKYDVVCLINNDPLLAHEGWVMFEDFYNALGMIVAGKLIPLSKTWHKEKRAAIINYILKEVGSTVRTHRFGYPYIPV